MTDKAMTVIKIRKFAKSINIQMNPEKYPETEVLFDEADYQKVSKYHWYLKAGCNTSYVNAQVDGKSVGMHRFLLNPPLNMEVDHINGNGLDNRRQNLRIVTPAQNRVFAAKLRRKWRSKIPQGL